MEFLVSFTVVDTLADTVDEYDGGIFLPITPDEMLLTIKDMSAGIEIKDFKMELKK